MTAPSTPILSDLAFRRETITNMSQPSAMIGLLLAGLDEAYDHPSWHGPNLRSALRGLSAEDALWRPMGSFGTGHNIWEIAVHAAYWKYIVARALTGEKRRYFPYAGANWFPRKDADTAAWRRDLEVLAEQHRKLRAAAWALDERVLNKRSPRGRVTYAGLIRGIAAHDLYHAGQIRLLRVIR
jgi:hypothetical protein